MHYLSAQSQAWILARRECVDWRSMVRISAIALLLLNTGCGTSEPQGATSKGVDTAAKVVVKQVDLEPWPQTVRVQGSLLGDEHAVVGSKLAGLVQTVPVDLGSVVRTRDVLVQLDRSELALRVKQAEAQLRQECAAIGLEPEQSEVDLDRRQSPPVMLERALVEEAEAALARAERLRTHNAITETEYERLQAQSKTASERYRSSLNSVGQQVALIGLRRAELALAEQQYRDAEIVAPFDGVVQMRHVSPGEYVQVGGPLVTLVRIDRLRFTAGVPEIKAARIHPGQTIYIKCGDLVEPLTAEVTRVSPTLVANSRSLWIEADLANADLALQAGLFAEGEIVIDPQAETLTVPIQAVTEFAGLQKVWLVRDEVAKEQPVTTGRRDDHRVEILSGLSAGDLIVRDFAAGHAGKVLAIQAATDTTRQATLDSQDPTEFVE